MLKDGESPVSGLSAAGLKYIAAASMLIDHIGAVILKEGTLYTACRLTGRIAFPIFCFLLVEGFVHTKNIKKYILRLLVFAIISEPAFDLALSGKIVYSGNQNVMWTLLTGIIMLYFVRKYETSAAGSTIAVAIACIAASVLKTDYGWYGELLIAVLYILRNRETEQTVIGGSMLLLQGTAIFGFIPIRLYSGERGRQSKLFFYIFYPAHLFILYVLAQGWKGHM